MKDRTLNIIALVLGTLLILLAFYLGCRALEMDRRLWLFAAVGATSPRGAETFAAPSYPVIISWNASKSGAEGYKVFIRKAGANYTAGMDVGTNRMVRVGLDRKTTYRVVVKAYNRGGETPSEEVSFKTGKNNQEPVEEL